jgi:geranylgeranyl pyrophosphate synthase
MAEADWPSSAEIHAAVRNRLLVLLDATGGLVAEIGRRTLAGQRGILSEAPHSLTTALPIGACITAGGDWRMAAWPAAGAECMMAAADLFDDAADLDPGGSSGPTPAVLLTAGAGLLSLASVAIVRASGDGVPPSSANALVTILGEGFARAANGQAANLEVSTGQVDALTAYRQSAAKSGPLGALIARLGGRVASDEPRILDLLSVFGHRLAVRSQLLNDARDAAPDPLALKADVRAGARTVPLAFTSSAGAPPGLNETQLDAWERDERARIALGGGIAAAQALAEAERLSALEALGELQHLGCPVEGLRRLL